MDISKPASIDVIIEALLNQEINSATPLIEIRNKIAGCYDRLLYHTEADLKHLLNIAEGQAEDHALFLTVKALLILARPAMIGHIQKGLGHIHPDVVQEMTVMFLKEIQSQGPQAIQNLIQSLSDSGTD